MSKVEISPAIAPFPKPIALVGSVVDGRPNFMNIAWVNRVNRSPNIIAASINIKHFTLEGIRQNGTFSVNFPDTTMVERTDYVGLVSGRDIDKSSVFQVFYGELKGAPMIQECPVCMECSVQQFVELPDHIIVLGEVIHTYTEEKYMTDGTLDPKKMDPVVFTRPGPIGMYWHLGEAVGQAWSIGKRLKEQG
ncbi:MAG: flavin reductase family protein [Candidatus Thorarchaeota archaeon]|jgi:flavin reductase (DIM6/NTAB) family NADH-FMN oxidoreductase RutF